MIDQPVRPTVRRDPGRPPVAAAVHRLVEVRPRAPLRPGAARLLVLLAAFVCAACGLVYELELVALGGALLGDPVTQASVVLSVMVFAMGVGSLLAKRFTRRPATSFAVVEGILALIGGLSGLVLYTCWAWPGGCRIVTVVLACLIGLLIGAEIPLLMTLIQRIRRQDAGRAVADLFAADYVGALVGGLAFPFLLLPTLGQAAGALLTGAVNALAGAVVALRLFRDELPRRSRLLLWAGLGVVLAVLATAAACTEDIERAARRELYGAEVRSARQTHYQEIVLVGGTSASGGSPLRLYRDGRLTVCGADVARYRRALVRPALAGPHSRVLVLGGGDGVALHEALLDPGVRRADVVEADPALTRLARTDPGLTAVNGHALGDPRVRVETAAVLGWLRTAATGGRSGAAGTGGAYDVVVADLPDPGQEQSAALYSEEFYALAARLLGPGGRLAVHAGQAGPSGSPAARRFWTVEATVRAAGLRTLPYAAWTGGPRCGGRSVRSGPSEPTEPFEQGFVLAARRPQALPSHATGFRPLEAHRPHPGPSAATLLHPLR
jgi:spermidine synthase